jgi:hypothetical protein
MNLWSIVLVHKHFISDKKSLIAVTGWGNNSFETQTGKEFRKFSNFERNISTINNSEKESEFGSNN